MLFSEALDFYSIYVLQEENRKEKTFRNYRTAVNSFISAIGDVEIESVGKDYIIRWKIHMQQAGNSQTCISGYLSCIRQMFRYFKDDRHFRVMDYRDIKCPKRDTKPKQILETQEIIDLINAAKNPRDKAITAMIFGTGCRPSEVLNIDTKPYERIQLTDEGTYHLKVKAAKGDKYRDIYLSPGIKQLVDAYRDTLDYPYEPLFVSGQKRRITLSRVQQIVHEMEARAGIEKNVTPYTGRHTYISDLLMNGAPVKSVSELVGHSKPSTTLNHYAHVLPNQNSKVHTGFHTSFM